MLHTIFTNNFQYIMDFLKIFYIYFLLLSLTAIAVCGNWMTNLLPNSTLSPISYCKTDPSTALAAFDMISLRLSKI